MDYYSDALRYKSLYKGLKRSCRNVRWKDSVIGYEQHGIILTYRLRDKILHGRYHISKYQKFKIYEPKERDILAPRLVDRQYQTSLIQNGLYQDITEHFIRDTYACQVNRGTGDALKRTKIHLERYYREHGCNWWVLKGDIYHFFPEIRHHIAKDAVRKYVHDWNAIDAVNEVIDSFPGDTGLGLGSPICQLVSNLVLCDMDHYIKERLHIRHYIRYADDFVIVHQDKRYLQYCRKAISIWLIKRELTLNKKTCIYPLKQGIRFLKWKFRVLDSGKILMLLGDEKLRKERVKLKKLWKMEQEGALEPGATWTSMNSFLANANRGNTHYKQCEMLDFYRDLTGKDFYEHRIP